MVNDTVDFLSDKGYALSPRSTNHKEDLAKQIFQEYKIALQIMAGHPDVLNEFVCAVKGGVNHPAPKPTAPVSKNLNQHGKSYPI